jgi:hypothetical protein
METMSRRTQFGNDHQHRPKHPSFDAPLVTPGDTGQLQQYFTYLRDFWVAMGRKRKPKRVYKPNGPRECARRRMQNGHHA